MKLNQRGGTLVTVLLVILVFSVLGFALMGSVVGENKRTNTTESNMQARYLAESGLTYFEKDFKTNFTAVLSEYLKSHLDAIVTNTDEEINALCKEYFFESFLNNYNKEVGTEKIQVKAVRNGDDIKVTSTARAGSSVETLVGYYEPSFLLDIDKKIYEFADFTAGGLAVDFTKLGLLQLDLLKNALHIEALNPPGDDKNYYPVPNDSILSADVGPILGLGIPSIDNFTTMRDFPVIATREGSILGLNLLGDMVYLNVAKYKNEKNTNVIIHGGHDILNVASIVKAKHFQDVNFKKLAVMGNTVIKQERWGNIELLDKLGLVSNLLDSLGLNFTINKLIDTLGLSKDGPGQRAFTFQDSLYVNRTLTIGGYRKKDYKLLWIFPKTDYEPKSNLKIRGNIGVMNNLKITDVTLDIGEKDKNQGIYVNGNAEINNAKVNNNGSKSNDYYDFRVFSKGKITFDNKGNSDESHTYNGIFYADEGVQFNTDRNKKITINGAIIGNIIYPENVQYNPDPELLGGLIGSYAHLIPKGRSFQE